MFSFHLSCVSIKSTDWPLRTESGSTVVNAMLRRIWSLAVTLTDGNSVLVGVNARLSFLSFFFFLVPWSRHMFSVCIKRLHAGSKTHTQIGCVFLLRFSCGMTPFISLENGGSCPPQKHMPRNISFKTANNELMLPGNTPKRQTHIQANICVIFKRIILVNKVVFSSFLATCSCFFLSFFLLPPPPPTQKSNPGELEWQSELNLDQQSRERWFKCGDIF